MNNQISSAVNDRHDLPALAVALMLAGGAMMRYPGGSPLVRASAGYSLTRNFLSDLGMTVAYNGRPNRLGALLFMASLLIIVVVLGRGAIDCLRRYVAERGARGWARAAAFFVLLTCMAFAAVAVTPENLVMPLHVDATLMAWRLFAGSAVLLFIASVRTDSARRRLTAAWGGLAMVLVAYALLLELGPSLSTDSGLRVNVVAQKAIAVIAVLLLTYLYRAVARVRGLARDARVLSHAGRATTRR